jgi:hypothetical protein
MENQFTILEQSTGKVLYCKKDNSVVENQLAITEMCTLENTEGKDIFYDFENDFFYLKD